MTPPTPTTRWRHGDRDTQARQAHNEDTTSWRRSLGEAVFTPDDQITLLDELRAGASLPVAAATIGLTHQAVYGRARWDADFAAALDDVLTQTCPGKPACGTATGAKRGGHCPPCRAAHHPPRAAMSAKPHRSARRTTSG